MTYFIHGLAIEAVQDTGQAEKYALAGWEVATREAWIEAWKAKDRRAIDELIASYRRARAMLARAAGVPVELVRHWN